jgi:hypothetical protein
MKMAKLYEPTGALVAGMDKKKAARQAASVASAVANGNGAPHIRVVARIVAHTLTAIGNQQADGAAAVRSPSRRATALTTPARCWCGIRRSRAPPRQSSAGPARAGCGRPWRFRTAGWSPPAASSASAAGCWCGTE